MHVSDDEHEEEAEEEGVHVKGGWPRGARNYLLEDVNALLNFIQDDWNGRLFIVLTLIRLICIIVQHAL